MRVLTVNCGSSSLKLARFDDRGPGDSAPARRTFTAVVDGVGEQGVLAASVDGRGVLRRELRAPDHGVALDEAIAALEGAGLLDPAALDAVGHRVVHGGPDFDGPARLDAAVLDAIEALAELAPLHNAAALQAIRAARARFGEAMPMVAVFDTAFHRTLPARAARYALPHDLVERRRIRRYGFHGLAHRSLAAGYAAASGRDLTGSRLITLQLGSGCSACAIDRGRSIDTSMGFSPTEGLVMATRCGDIDPVLPGLLAEWESVSPGEVERWLNRRSGLLGVSGRSGDMRDLLAAAGGGDTRAALAIDLFCYRVRKVIGSYLAALSGADAVVFGGGIGEHAPAIRARICSGLEPLGLALDSERNQGNGRSAAARAPDRAAEARSAPAGAAGGRISRDDSPVAIYVVPTDEEAIIAADVAACLTGH